MQDSPPGVMQTKSLFTLSNSFDNCDVRIWPLAVLSLAFRYSKIFLWHALQYHCYHWIVLIAQCSN